MVGLDGCGGRISSIPTGPDKRRNGLLALSDSQAHLESMEEESKNPLYRLFYVVDIAAGCLPILKKTGRPAKTVFEKQALSVL